MNEASIDSQDAAPEMETPSDASTPRRGPRHDGAAVNPGISIGLAELHAMEMAYRALEALERDGQYRALKWLTETLGLYPPRDARSAKTERIIPYPGAPAGVTPRDFISEKRPASLVERIACLGYYLTHYRGMPHFKATDVVVLNTEAATSKIGNPSRDFDHADRQNGYLAAVGNGTKQLTIRGEAMVEALPSREAVRKVLEEHPHKSRRALNTAKKAAS
jgi:hypothetical protein